MASHLLRLAMTSTVIVALPSASGSPLGLNVFLMLPCNQLSTFVQFSFVKYMVVHIHLLCQHITYSALFSFSGSNKNILPLLHQHNMISRIDNIQNQQKNKHPQFVILLVHIGAQTHKTQRSRFCREKKKSKSQSFEWLKLEKRCFHSS